MCQNIYFFVVPVDYVLLQTWSKLWSLPILEEEQIFNGVNHIKSLILITIYKKCYLIFEWPPIVITRKEFLVWLQTTIWNLVLPALNNTHCFHFRFFSFRICPLCFLLDLNDYSAYSLLPPYYHLCLSFLFILAVLRKIFTPPSPTQKMDYIFFADLQPFKLI
jgi:hypothetical protein